MKNPQIIKYVSLGISAFLIVGFVSLLVFANAQKGDRPLLPVSTDEFGGPYTLTNHLGETITEKDLKGQYQLLYFGFTYCPAICPTELSKMTEVLNILGEDGKKIQPVFITVDPERDTVEVMKSYIELFHERFIGYTGTVEQIEDIKKKYKVYATKVDDPTMTEYTVDHSSYIYFLDPDGQLLSLYKMGDSVDDMTQNIRRWLDQEQNS
ncbi:MAG: SCO family protein [Pseudomonadota bacterium]